MDSGIIRTVKDERWQVVSNEPFEDSRLSWEARGVLAYLLTKPDGWITRNQDLINQGPAGRNKVKRIISDLRKFGYLKRYRFRRENGRFGWITLVFESPNPDSSDLSHSPKIDPRTIAPKTVDGFGGHIVNTDIANTDFKNKEITENDLFDSQADLQQLGLIIRLDLGGDGDAVRRARELYFKHRTQLNLEEIAEMAVE